MKRRSNRRFLALLFALPVLSFWAPVAHAATVFSAQTISISSSTPDNAYIFAEQARVDAPLPADLCVAAGTVTVAAPIGGDALLAGGTVDIQQPVAGDVRVVGGRVTDDDPVGGDLMVAGGAVSISGRAKDTHIIGGNVDLLNGSNGPVVVYGADVSLSGEFDGPVEVVASDKITIQDGTIIHGVFKYNAPQQADIPATAQISGGVNYIGSATWLPTEKQAKTFATAGLWVFILVRLTAVLVVTGLIAGLFPLFTDRLVEVSLRRTPERTILLTLLGFAGFVAVPALILFLSVSFVGIGIALVLLAAYLLFLMLSYIYAGVLAGAALLYLFRNRGDKKNKQHAAWRISWRGALLGVLVLYLVSSLPFIGFAIRVIVSATAGGALLSLFYTFAFRRDPIDLSDLA